MGDGNLYSTVGQHSSMPGHLAEKRVRKGDFSLSQNSESWVSQYLHVLTIKCKNVRVIGERDMSKNTAAWQGFYMLHHPFPTRGQDPFCSPKPSTSLGISKVTAEPTKLFPNLCKTMLQSHLYPSNVLAPGRNRWTELASQPGR